MTNLKCERCGGPTELAFMHRHCVANCADKPLQRLGLECWVPQMMNGMVVRCVFCPCGDSDENDVGREFKMAPELFARDRTQHEWVKCPPTQLTLIYTGWADHKFEEVVS